MKILFLTFNPFRAYPNYKRAVGTGQALALSGHKVFVVVEDCQENRERMELEAPHCIGLYFKHGLARECFSKLRYIWRIKPDVLYTTSYSVHNLACLGFLLPWRIKKVLEFCELYSRYPGRRYNWSLWETLGLFSSRYILCASRYLENHFACACRKMHLSRSLFYSP